MPSDPSALRLVYKLPTNVNNFYVLRARRLGTADKSPDAASPTSLDSAVQDAQKNSISQPAGGPIIVEAELETVKGKLVVKVQSTWDI